jgi:hypothetical protein
MAVAGERPVDPDPDQRELEQLFLGVLAPFTRGPEAEPLPFPKAITGALAIIYRREAQAVREVLNRVEAALPNEREYAEGEVDPSEYNLRITSMIRGELARLDKLDADVDRMLKEMDAR